MVSSIGISKFINLCLLLCILSACGEKKLTLYQCTSKGFAESCTKTCEQNEKMKYVFLINKNEKNVMQKIYLNNEMQGSLLHENCKIFNDSNWDCSTEKKWEEVSYENNIKMVDGVFSNTTSYKEHKTLIDRSKDEIGFCAK
jgi:hypothetical protein